MPKPEKKAKKIEPGQNIHIDRILAIYPDDEHDIYKIDGEIELRKKEAGNG